MYPGSRYVATGTYLLLLRSCFVLRCVLTSWLGEDYRGAGDGAWGGSCVGGVEEVGVEGETSFGWLWQRVR